MKYACLLYGIMVLIISSIVLAEVQFSEPKIIDVLPHSVSLYIADLNGDNNKDVLVGYSDKIVWYENKDGKGTYNTGAVINASSGMIRSIFAADLDNDGDKDVLVAEDTFSGDDNISWYENIDGTGAFGYKQVISTLVVFPESIHATDIDGDGDMDVVSASMKDDKIAWYKNKGGGVFGTQKVIYLFTDLEAMNVCAFDIDGDGDMDIIASPRDKKIAFFENEDGDGAFSLKQMISTSHQTNELALADMDRDGDMDVISAASADDKIVWHEYMSSNGLFDAQHIIKEPVKWPSGNRISSIHPTDFDNDGDMDIISGTRKSDKIFYYENEDENVFTQRHILTSLTCANHVSASDLDNDGDMDVIACSLTGILWYENLTNPTSIKNSKLEFKINFQLQQNYPNPFNPSTTIKYNFKKSNNVELKIYNLFGQEIETLVNEFQTAGEHKITWQPNGLPSGIYFYRLEAGDPSTSSPWQNMGQAGQRFSETKKLILVR